MIWAVSKVTPAFGSAQCLVTLPSVFTTFFSGVTFCRAATMLLYPLELPNKNFL